jgi:hypothetical protein
VFHYQREKSEDHLVLLVEEEAYVDVDRMALYLDNLEIAHEMT